MARVVGSQGHETTVCKSISGISYLALPKRSANEVIVCRGRVLISPCPRATRLRGRLLHSHHASLFTSSFKRAQGTVYMRHRYRCHCGMEQQHSAHRMYGYTSCHASLLSKQSSQLKSAYNLLTLTCSLFTYLTCQYYLFRFEN